VLHQPVSRGFAVFADAWLPGWLAEISADLRENGSALEVVLHDYALYKSTFTLLLYFTKILATKPNETKLTLVQVAVYAMIRPINGLGPPVFYNNSARDPHEPMLRVNGCSSRLETFTTNGNGCGIVLGGSTMQWGAWRGLL